MPKKILILSRFVNEYEPKRLVEEGRKTGNQTDLVKYGQIFLSESAIDLGKNRQLTDYDLIIPRAASKRGSSMVSVKTAILQAIDNPNKIINGRSFLKYPLLGKIEQALALTRNSLPTVPISVFGSKLGWNDFLSSLINFPIVVKGRFGSHGRTVNLVDNKEEMRKLINGYKEGNVLIQPVLNIKQWYRTIVVGNKYLGEMRHRQKSKFNPSTGKLVKLNRKHMDQLAEISLKAAKTFDCDFCGIDIGWEEKKQAWVIFEVNRTAQFKYFEKRTGVNVAAMILSSV